MPKEVDHDERRDEILSAVAGVLADSGLRGLTIRSLAARLGGSVSVVTHYFPTRHKLLVNLGPWLLKKWQAEVESFTDGGGERIAVLRSVLAWLIPLTPESLLEEQAAMSLVVGTESDAASVRGLRTELAAWVRDLIRVHLAGLVDEDRLEPTLDALYTITQGISVSVCEEPDAWPAERQLAVLDDLLDLLGLLPAGAGDPNRLTGVKKNERRGGSKVKEGT